MLPDRSSVPRKHLPGAKNYHRPPTASEREKILAQVQLDEALLDYLKRQLSERQKAANLAYAQVDIEWDRVEAAEYDFSNAKRLHEDLISAQQTLTGPFLPENHSPLADRTITYTNQNVLARIMEQKSEALLTIQEHSSRAQQTLHLASESVLISKENLYSAISFELQLNETVSALQSFIDITEGLVQKKRDVFRAIWRVPSSAWLEIFDFVVEADDPSSIPAPMPHGWAQGCRALLLSGVSSAWRSVVQGNRSLWRNLHIHMGQNSESNLSRVTQHVSLMGIHPASLKIIAYTKSSDQYFDSLVGILSKISAIRNIRLKVDRSGRFQVQTLLNRIKSPEKLFLSSSTTSPYLCNFYLTPETMKCVKILTLESCQVTRRPENPYTCTLRELRIVAVTGPWLLPHQYFPMSADSLERLYLKVPLAPTSHTVRDQVISMRSLHTIQTDLRTLVCDLYPYYSFPVLRSITVTQAIKPPADNWAAFATASDGGAFIDSIKINPIGDAASMVPTLARLPKLSCLTLFANEVDVVLDAILNLRDGERDVNTLPMPNLRELYISGYQENGMSVLNFVRERLAAGRLSFSVST